MRPTLTALLLTLACCNGPISDNPFAAAGSSAGNADTNVAGIDYGNRHSAGLAGMDQAARASTLAQAVRSTNRRCASISRTEYKGSFEGRAFWAVQCGGADYLVAIAKDGAVSAETCSVQATVGPGCWVEW